MGSLEDFLGKGEKPQLPGQQVGGSFQCQECYESVSEAYLNYEEGLLSWVCSKNHISNIGMNV